MEEHCKIRLVNRTQLHAAIAAASTAAHFQALQFEKNKINARKREREKKEIEREREIEACRR